MFTMPAYASSDADRVRAVAPQLRRAVCYDDFEHEIPSPRCRRDSSTARFCSPRVERIVRRTGTRPRCRSRVSVVGGGRRGGDGSTSEAAGRRTNEKRRPPPLGRAIVPWSAEDQEARPRRGRRETTHATAKKSNDYSV